MHTAVAIFAMYFAYVLIVGSIVLVSTTKNRAILIISAATIPVAFVVSLIMFLKDLVTGNLLKTEPCPGRLEHAEMMVEEKRASIFGGEACAPSLAPMWEQRYRMYLSKSAHSISSLVTHKKQRNGESMAA